MNDAPSATCSESCLASGEPLAGTASDARFFAAVSWPKALWHHDKVALSERLPKAIGELEQRARQGGRKLQLRLFQRAGSAETEVLELFCADFVSGRTATLRGSRPKPAPNAWRASSRATTPRPRSSARSCWSAPTASTICAAASSPLDPGALRADGRIDAVEASHLGGHRLAANCLALPGGELYGRVGSADVPASWSP
jgi:hypothetical protein